MSSPSQKALEILATSPPPDISGQESEEPSRDAELHMSRRDRKIIYHKFLIGVWVMRHRNIPIGASEKVEKRRENKSHNFMNRGYAPKHHMSHFPRSWSMPPEDMSGVKCHGNVQYKQRTVQDCGNPEQPHVQRKAPTANILYIHYGQRT